MVPEDRKQLARFHGKPVRWNVSVAALPALSGRGGVISHCRAGARPRNGCSP